MTDQCCVCIETFTKQPSKKQAKCPYCDVKACVGCTQQYLLSINEDPHCMGCRKAWSREVMDQLLLVTWLNDTYKKHRETILTDRERSRLPAAQIIVERRKSAKDHYPIRDKIMGDIRELEGQIAVLRGEYYTVCRRIEILLQGGDPFATGTATKAKEEERRVFVMPCPGANCRGFLSQAYKCGVCDIYVCPECREIKGLQRDAEHTCNPDTVATVQKMKKECRPCPECGASIFKIEGCDQMYCTACNTPFSWNTGKKVTTGAIHNPHYFEYMRKVNGGAPVRNPGDIPCLAHLPGAWEYDRAVIRKYSLNSMKEAMELYQALMQLTHIHAVEIPAVTNRAEDQDNTDYNVAYLLNEMNEARWKQLIQQKEKKRMKKDEIRMRYEAFVAACVDIFGRLMNHGRTLTTSKEDQALIRKAILETHQQFTVMVNIFNDSMKEISRRYKCTVLTLDSGFKRTKYKFTTGRKVKKGKKDVKKDDAAAFSDDDSEEESVQPTNEIVKT